ncbi:MAG: DNA/RNA nuclease SfsA [Oscillospiraceae bacterium]|nr:DNA/RNA nuclease SfsA [Oscillospiraceae bacterium]
MQYGEVRQGRFLTRPNRFIAHVELDGCETVCHVKNTGRCRELLIEGAVVYLEKGTNPNRKTAWDLIAVEKGDMLINMDSQAPNKVFAEFACTYDPLAVEVRGEYSFGNSRLDFCLTHCDGRLHLVEVKGVTLEREGHAFFPDAPTERGVRHLRELTEAVGQGHLATVFFVVKMGQATDFAPNDETHPAFGAALREAAAAGVRVVAYCCRVSPNRLEIDREIPVIL